MSKERTDEILAELKAIAEQLSLLSNSSNEAQQKIKNIEQHIEAITVTLQRGQILHNNIIEYFEREALALREFIDGFVVVRATTLNANNSILENSYNSDDSDDSGFLGVINSASTKTA